MPGIRQREGLIARVRQIRTAGAPGVLADAPDPGAAVTLGELEHRVAHLEEQLRGLQDSVHRENVRQDGRLADLAARLEPAAIAVALEKDARDRGL